MDDRSMKSPIRYFGGKGGMYKQIIAQFPLDKKINAYIEPFGGGASILFQKEPSDIEIYNDLNENVYSLFKVLNNSKMFASFRQKCDKIYFSKHIFQEFTDKLTDKSLSVEDRAFMFYYVNRVAYNGSGSFSYSIDCVRRGMSKPVSDMLSSIDRLEEIHCRLKSVIIENRDALELIPKHDKSNVFFYLDPPYHQDTRTMARYDIDMTNDQHENFIDVLLNIKNAKVLVSGYDVGLYDKLTNNGWIKFDFDVKTQSGTRETRTKTESLWRNYQLSKGNKTEKTKEVEGTGFSWL
jgi:DNA adenine methylase